MEPMFFERLSTSPDVLGTNNWFESLALLTRATLLVGDLCYRKAAAQPKRYADSQ